MNYEHICKPMTQHEKGKFGAAVETIFYCHAGSDLPAGWWIVGGLNEYYSRITFCPFCGVQLSECYWFGWSLGQWLIAIPSIIIFWSVAIVGLIAIFKFAKEW